MLEILQLFEGRCYDSCCRFRVVILTTADGNDGDWVLSPLLEKQKNKLDMILLNVIS